MKILLLFTLTAILTWYGKFGSTHFLFHRINVYSQIHSQNCTVYLINNKKKESTGVYLHFSGEIVPFPQDVSLPETWDGIFLSPFSETPFNSAPESFYLPGTIFDKVDIPADWPLPDTSALKQGTLKAERFTFDNPGISVYSCEWEEVKLLLVRITDDKLVYPDLSSFNEQTDILLIQSKKCSPVLKYREQIRPLYTIGLCESDQSVKSFPNLFLITTDEMQTHHFRAEKNRLLRHVSSSTTR